MDDGKMTSVALSNYEVARNVERILEIGRSINRGRDVETDEKPAREAKSEARGEPHKSVSQ